MNNSNIPKGAEMTIKLEECLNLIGRLAAWGWIVARFVPGAVRCPTCGTELTSEKAVKRFLAMERTYCKACDRVVLPTAGTPLHDTCWQPEELVKLVILADAGRTVAEISKALGKGRESVKTMLERVELALLPDGAPSDTGMQGS